MKFLKAKILSCILIITVFVSVIPFRELFVLASGLMEQYQLVSKEEIGDEYKNNAPKAAQQYTRLFQYWEERLPKTQEVEKGYTVNGVSRKGIPDYFGGAYINKFGKLVIEINEIYEESFYEEMIFDELLNIMDATPDDIVIQFSHNSYGALMLGMERLLEVLKSGELGPFGFGIDDYNKRLTINYPKVNGRREKKRIEKRIEEELQGIPFIILFDTFDPIDDIFLYPGEGVHGTEGIFSIAFPVKIDTSATSYKLGYLTCAHCLGNQNYDVVFSLNDDVIGSMSRTCYNYGGTSDVAFIETNSNVNIYHTLYQGTTIIWPGYTTLPIGYVVNKKGWNTGNTTGVVLDSSFSYEVNGIFFTDLGKSDYNSSSGDSGGLVYDTPNLYNYAYPVGIHKGRTSALFGSSVYTKAGNALSTLGAAMYYNPNGV